jgi:type IV secretory pathway VirB6-like protein
MKPINTKTHGYMDYIMGVLLIAAPWIFNFARNGAETWVPVVLGIATIIYSLLTDYELGVSHVIPMRTHLILDIASGVLLAVSPWLFNFDEYIWQPHLILGILEVGAALLTKSVPGERRAPVDRNIHRTTPSVR